MTAGRMGVIAKPQVWTPASLGSDLYAWFDASDTGSISHTANAVDQWNDKSGNGLHVTGSGGTRPTTNTVTRNSLNVISFVSQYLTAATLPPWKFLHDNSNDAGFTAVVNFFPGSSNPNAAAGLFGTNAGTRLNTGAFCLFDDRSTASFNNAYRYMASASDSGNAVCSSDAGDVLTPNAWHQIHASWDLDLTPVGSRAVGYVDGSNVGLTNAQNKAATSANPSYPLQIGSTGNAVLPATMYLAEMVFYKNGATNRTVVRDYITTKWAV